MDRVPVVLVVEDEENVRFISVVALQRAGFEVIPVASGRDALRAFGDVKAIDLVVLDVNLPDLDGFEVCHRLRAEGVDTPIVFLTARDATDDRLRGLTIGGDDYITKPFSLEELVARVRVILRRSSAVDARSPALTAGDVELDDDAHVVRRGTTEVALSPTEYKLLRFLLRNKGRAMTRAQILDHVWDYDFDGESTVVETFVSSLRRKIDPNADLIRTVRGIGYRLSEP